MLIEVKYSRPQVSVHGLMVVMTIALRYVGAKMEITVVMVMRRFASAEASARQQARIQQGRDKRSCHLLEYNT